MSELRDVDELLALYDRLGDGHFGEAVSQTQHAVQCAALARADGADDALVAAALLHDVGHLLAPPRPADWRDEADDDRHEAVGAAALAPLFGPSVAAPVALHVTAKRWRCAVDPAYARSLSAASLATLVAQGGPLDADGVERFASHPAFAAAVRLREYDEGGKDPSGAAGTVGDHEALLRALADAHAARR